MLENIKSHYIYKFCFSYIDERNKLKLVRYNKSLQNKLQISLINYKIFSGKYIIYEKEGKVKEYNLSNDNLIFEGKYINGKKNGKGKEYYPNSKDCLLSFKGEYLNGKRNGKGKEYNRNGRLKFEGEYLNGKRNGKGKEYHDISGLYFEGEYFNDKRWIGKLYRPLHKTFDYIKMEKVGKLKNIMIMVI